MVNEIIDNILQPLGYVDLIISQTNGGDEDGNGETGKSIMGKMDPVKFYNSVKDSGNISDTLGSMFTEPDTENNEGQTMAYRIGMVQGEDIDKNDQDKYDAFKQKVAELKKTDVEELKKNTSWIGMFLKDDDIAELLEGPDMEGGRRRRRRRKSRKARKGRKSRKSRRKGKKSRRKGKKARRRTRRRRRR